MIKRFLFYGALGWLMEVSWTGIGSVFKGDIRLYSQTSIWMFPIYALAIFLEPLHYKLFRCPVMLRGGIYTVLIFATEYLTGTLLRLLLGVCPWKYTDIMNINGIITLKYIPLWFLLGIFYEIIHERLDRVHIFFDPL